MALFLLNAVEDGLLKPIGDFSMNKEPDHVLDIAGTVIPLALLKVSALFKEMRVHETVDVVGADWETKEDLLKVLPASCCEVVAINACGPDQPVYRVLFRKTAKF
jgi:TusA-related sulfurtransferase